MEASSATGNSPSARPRSVVDDACHNTESDLHEKHTETGAADGFLFPPEDLILSVLDLTRELENLGVIEIHELANGAQAYRIIAPDKKVSRSRQPTGEIVDRLGKIFRRRGSTLWSAEEIKAFTRSGLTRGLKSSKVLRERAGRETPHLTTLPPSCALPRESTARGAGRETPPEALLLMPLPPAQLKRSPRTRGHPPSAKLELAMEMLGNGYPKAQSR
jgi:hypothetical protein